MTELQERWSRRAEPSAVRELRRAVAEFAVQGGFADGALDDVRACLSEAVTNSVVHAFRDDRAVGTVTVTAALDEHQLQVVVSDDGIGFRPRSDSPGIGLGIPTIAALSTSMSVDVSDAGGASLCMCFARERIRTPAAG